MNDLGFYLETCLNSIVDTSISVGKKSIEMSQRIPGVFNEVLGGAKFALGVVDDGLVKADEVCDYIPGVSTVTNSMGLVAKLAFVIADVTQALEKRVSQRLATKKVAPRTYSQRSEQKTGIFFQIFSSACNSVASALRAPLLGKRIVLRTTAKERLLNAIPFYKITKVVAERIF